jgi:hypothetical protein
MAELEIKTCVGMGDFVLSYSQLERIKNKYSEIRVCPSYHLLDVYRSGSKEIHEFTKNFASLLFDSPPYKLLDKSEAPLTSPDDLFHHMKLRPSYVDLSEKLCLKEDIGFDIGCEYIVIQTKIRYIDRSLFNSLSERIFSTIKNIKKYKIVLMGEHSTGACKESQVHNQRIFIIYDELKKALQNVDHVDLTKDVLLDNPNIDNLRRDLTIMRNAKCVIVFGVSGIVTTIAATAKNVIGFRADNEITVTSFLENMDKENKLITSDFNQFISQIEQKLF